MITCWQCGRDNEAFFKFCLACGAELDKPAPIAAAPEPAPLAPKTAAIPEGGATLVDMPAVQSPGLVVIRPDQSEGERFALREGTNAIGRTADAVSFGGDDFLAPRHLDLVVRGAEARVEPHASRNGTFLRLQGPVRLQHGDEFRIGQQLIRIDWIERLAAEGASGPNGETTLGSPVPDAAWGRLSVLVQPSRVAAAYMLSTDEISMGRETGDITFAHDPFVSGRHAVIRRRDDGTVELEDVGSRNGTYIRLREARSVKTGDMLLAGQQLLRVQLA